MRPIYFYYQERAAAPSRRVNYAALDVEELGSVYESLLEFHPDIATDAVGRLQFDLSFGSERKTTCSFYTPPELVNEPVESALVPVVRQHLVVAAIADKRDAGVKHQRAALLSLKIIDVACGSGHMLLAAALRVGKELARLDTGEDEPAPESIRESIRDVISHCIYGVDRSPLAVDLRRVAIWLESHTAGKPPPFSTTASAAATRWSACSTWTFCLKGLLSISSALSLTWPRVRQPMRDEYEKH